MASSARQRGFLTVSEILAVGGHDLPRTVRSLNRLIAREGWRKDPARARKISARGGGWLYHISLLPPAVQASLTAPENEAQQTDRETAWDTYEQLPPRQKKAAETRLAALDQVDALVNGGAGVSTALRRVASARGVSVATLSNWRTAVRHVPRCDWLPALAPRHKGNGARAICHPEAYALLKSDYLRPEAPTFSACYRRMKQAAKTFSWSPIPSERALRRHLEVDVGHDVQVMARKGRESAKALFPAQRRTRDALHAMQAVNMDGHKFDVFVEIEPGRIGRLYLIALQDLYSNKFVAWRLAEAERKETVRLVIGDMVSRYGIPDQIVLDNGRAFASKWITGGARTRFRYKVRDEDPQGLLVSLGVNLHWTTPYSGQSKPIERAFRDMADSIARHPACAGAYTGNKPDAKPENYASKAVPIDLFRQLVAQGIAEHNSRPGRKTPVAQGRSFDGVFEQSLADENTIVRWPTAAQRALWLLAADRIKASRGNGEISFYGNRYWHPALTAHAGKPVTVRFDPDDLRQPLRVYDSADQPICEAALIDDAGFFDVSAARRHARKRGDFMKAVKAQQKLHAELTAEQLADLYDKATPELEDPAPMAPAIPRLMPIGGAALKAAPEPFDDEQNDPDDTMEADFSRGLRLVAGAMRRD